MRRRSAIVALPASNNASMISAHSPSVGTGVTTAAGGGAVTSSLTIVPIPRPRLVEFLARDKKVADGALRFVLLEGIGRVKPGQTVLPEVLEVALSTVGL